MAAFTISPPFPSYDTPPPESSNCTMFLARGERSIGPDISIAKERLVIIRSPHPPVPLSGLRLTEFVLAHAAEAGRKPAIIDGTSGRAISYRDLAAAITSAAAGLTRRGVRRGDVIALVSPNCPEFAIAFHGAVLAGATVSPASPLGPAAELTRQLTHSAARWMITAAALFEDYGRAAAAAAGLGPDSVFVFGEARGALPFASLLDAPSAVQSGPTLSPDDLAYLPYSSGTTGLPKGVMITHRNLVANLCQIRPVHRIRGTDVVLAVLPWFHIFGLQGSLNLALREAATIVTMPRFEPREFLQLVQTHKVTRVCVVPPIVLALAAQPAVGGYDTSSLRLITSGAAPLGVDLARACAQLLRCEVNQAYGMTEFGWSHTMPDDVKDSPDCVGPALPGIECRVVDCTTGLDVPCGTPGELLVRSPASMRGYLDNGEATAATVDADGFVHTGDIVVADESGCFRIVGRLKEIIKYKGHQVAPAALEAILLRHPAVADAAVIGWPHEEAGELPTAFVVARQPVRADDLMVFVARQVAPHEKIRRLEFTDEIPRSPSGKVLRGLLADRQPAATTLAETLP
jgi:acyl-CoA synthetase (AMP-forming)/AMP-acid ligase II